jgi:Flp pilus assembly protein TadG
MTVFARLLRNERGNSFVELGLVAPVLAAMLIGMVDISRAYAHRLQLEQAAQRTIEKVMQEPGVLTDYTASLKAEGAAAAGVEEDAVVPDFYLECSTDGTTWAESTTFTSGCPVGTLYYARYVNVAISKAFTPTFSSQYFPGANSNGTVTLTGRAGIRIQ